MYYQTESDQESLWDSVLTLYTIDKKMALSVFKETVKNIFATMRVHLHISEIIFELPLKKDLYTLKHIDHQIQEALQQSDKKKACEMLVDFIDQLSNMHEKNSNTINRQVMVSLLEQQSKMMKENDVSSQTLHAKTEENFYSPNEVARKIGLSDQTVRRMCENGKFPGAYKTSGGHWKIPEKLFISTRDQDKNAELVFERIDIRNRKYGDIDEYHL